MCSQSDRLGCKCNTTCFTLLVLLHAISAVLCSHQMPGSFWHVCLQLRRLAISNDAKHAPAQGVLADAVGDIMTTTRLRSGLLRLIVNGGLVAASDR